MGNCGTVKRGADCCFAVVVEACVGDIIVLMMAL
jgi:hypothetical protein